MGWGLRNSFLITDSAAASATNLRPGGLVDQNRKVDRRDFLRTAALAAVVPLQRVGKPRASEFVFARLRYESGDWDYNPKVAANVLDSIVQYTSIPVYNDEVVIAASSTELLAFPFVFMIFRIRQGADPCDG